MLRRLRLAMLAGLVGLGMWLASPGSTQAQDYDMGRFFYYPYYYFPHSYWPSLGKEWPERPGMPYVAPPPYMAYPPFHEPHWRYDMHERQSYYRGFHFWLDAF
jgi:hypothetical protein